MTYAVSVCAALASGWLGWRAAKADGKGRIIYLVLAFSVCAANACIQKMCLQ